ncbi:MAG: hypothetical protein MUO22_07675 [Sedimentisphaerales bacterium]|nr:hypothetical protein [Sedimentisphaerales bacterium]
MSEFLIVTILAQGSGGDDTFWVQLLVIVVLAAGVGIYSLVRKKSHKLEEHQDYASYENVTGGQRQWRWKIQPVHKGHGEVKATVGAPLLKTQQTGNSTVQVRKQRAFGFASDGKGRDLHGGMELLELGFLLSVLEEMSSAEVSDVTMRKLSFEELLRRDRLSRISSKALKLYAKDEQGFYGRKIQCEAMKQLSQRTKALQQASVETVAKGA